LINAEEFSARPTAALPVQSSATVPERSSPHHAEQQSLPPHITDMSDAS